MVFWSKSSKCLKLLKLSLAWAGWQIFCSLERVEKGRLTMTDLTLGYFKSLSKQELSRRLRQEEFEMHGSHPVPLALPPTRSFEGRLRRLISSGLQIPLSLQRRFFRNFA